MSMIRRIFPVVLVLFWMSPGVSAAVAGQANLVLNGDFSAVTAGKPDGWDISGNARDVSQALTVEKTADGRPCVKLACTRFQYSGGDSHAMLAQVGGARLVKGRTYEFSCRLRAEGLAGRCVHVAMQNTADWTPAGLHEDLPVGRTWQTHRTLFRAARDLGPAGRLQIWFTETGTLWVADVRIVEVAAQDVAFTDVVPPAGGTNLVYNGSFEVGTAGWSSLGLGAGWGDLDRLHGRIEDGDASHGRHFLRIPLGGADTPVTYFDYFEPVLRRELRPLAASLGWIRVQRGAPYTLSCAMRAGAEGVRALLGARDRQPGGSWGDHQQSVRLTRAWKRYSLTFRPQRDYVFVLAGPDLQAEQAAYVDLDAVQLEKGEQAGAFAPRQAIEFALEPSQPAGIFVAGQETALRLRLCNHGPAATSASVTFRVTDFEDRPVELGGQSIDVPAGAAVTRDVPLPPAWRGFYRVKVTQPPLLPPVAADLRIALVPPRSADDSVAGMNHAFSTSFLIDQASKGGITWYRDWSLKWQHAEPQKGRLDWTAAQAQIDRVLARKVHLMALLPPFPSSEWASEAPAGLATSGYPGVRIRQAYAPRDPGEMGAFIEQAVARFQDRVKVWEFLNEPIYTDYALPGRGKGGAKGYTVDDYVRLLAVASAAMHKADPACRVMGGIAGPPRLLTREVLRAGCLPHVDIFNLHLYPGLQLPESYASEMDGLLADMDLSGGRKPIWITEFGYYATDDLPRTPYIPSDSGSDLPLLDSELRCAQYTVRFFATMMSRGVEKIFLHAGASGQVNDPSYECPLFEYGGRPRKLLPALAVYTELLGGAPKPAGYTRIGPCGQAVAFETGKNAVLVLWALEDGEVEVGLGTGAKAAGGAGTKGLADSGLTCLDMMGRPLAVGQTVRLGPSPIYLVGPSGSAARSLAALRAK